MHRYVHDKMSMRTWESGSSFFSFSCPTIHPQITDNLAVYFTLTSAVTSSLLHEELQYLRNSTDLRPWSFIDPETTSYTSMVFSALILSFSSFGIVASILLLYGLYRDQRILLIPWVLALIGFVAVDVAHCIYLFITHTLVVNPMTAILFTLDFFLHTLNLYALLCVISQYQELKAGRGRAEDDNHRIPTIHYTAQPTATSYLSTKKPAGYTETRPTPTQSPTGTGPQTSLGTEEPSPHIVNRGPRKSVKFPDHDSPTHNGTQLLEPWTMDMTMLLANSSVNEH